MPRFYVDTALRAGTSCLLPEESAHHAVHVLRIRTGDDEFAPWTLGATM